MTPSDAPWPNGTPPHSDAPDAPVPGTTEILLDIDGVLISGNAMSEHFHRTGSSAPMDCWDAGAVSRIETLLAEFPEARLVLNSTWRTKAQRLQALARQPGLWSHLHSRTPAGGLSQRPKDIVALHLQAGGSPHFLCIDDSASELRDTYGEAHVVACDFERGFDEAALQDARQKLTALRMAARIPQGELP